MPKYTCNHCNEQTGGTYGPCILTVDIDESPPAYCPYDDCADCEWEVVE